MPTTLFHRDAEVRDEHISIYSQTVDGCVYLYLLKAIDVRCKNLVGYGTLVSSILLSLKIDVTWPVWKVYKKNALGD